MENKLLKKKNVFYVLKKNTSKSKRSKEITNTTEKEKQKDAQIVAKTKSKGKSMSKKGRLTNKLMHPYITVQQ